MVKGFNEFNVICAARMVQIAAQVGGQSCMAWCLGTEGRGSYAICSLFALMLVLVFSVGCDIASVYLVASKRFTVSDGIVNALVYGGIGSVIAIAAGVTLMQLPIAFFNKAPRLSFYLALGSIPFSLLSQVLTRLLTAVQLFRWFGVISIIKGISYLLLMVLFLRFFSWGVNGAVLVLILNGLIGIIISLVLLWCNCGLVWVRPSLGKLLEMLHYGVRYYIGMLSNQVNYQVGTLVLAFFATTSEIGLFAVAMRLATQIMVIPDTMTTVMMPKIADDEKGKAEVLARCSRFTGLFCGFMLILIGVLAKPLVNVVFSPAFAAAIPLIRILCFGVFVRCISKIFVPYFLGSNRPGIVSLSVAVGTAVNLVAIWILVPRIGLAGASLGVVLSYLVSSIILTIMFVRLSGVTLRTAMTFDKVDWGLLVRSIRHCIRSSKQSLGIR